MPDQDVRKWRLREFLMMVAAVLLVASPLRLAAENASGTDARTMALAQAGATTGADTEELKALTNEVLQSLGAITGAGADTARHVRPQEQAGGGPQDYAQLMQALTSLVRKATVQGKSSEEIMALIEEALADQDQATLDALLRQAGGKVGLRKLLSALVQKAAMQASADDPYVQALQAEGDATRVAGTGKPATAGEGGRRTIVVQPGDTLSIIALRVYGSVGKWHDIYDANRDRLSDPDLVPAGIRLRLP